VKKAAVRIARSKNPPTIPATIPAVFGFDLEVFRSGEGEIDQGGKAEGIATGITVIVGAELRTEVPKLEV
jgi:hypothetical protein